MKAIAMYVNGHTLNNKNPGAAGSGVVLSYEDKTKEWHYKMGLTTNNHAELEGVLFGLGLLNFACEVTVYSCSQWLVNCGNKTWQRSKYKDLWQELDSLEHKITFQWIKKGSHELLDRASALANEAANESAVELEQK